MEEGVYCYQKIRHNVVYFQCYFTERTEIMITDTAGTFTYTETDFSLNVSLATDGLSS